MILERTPLTYNEVEDILSGIPENPKKLEVEEFLKKFMKAKPEQAKQIKEILEKMDLIKLKREHIVKIVDLLPKDAADLNKIFADMSLTEDETTKILDVVKSAK